MKDAELKPYLIQAVDYSYSDYDYQPEEGRSLGAEDEYYEDITPARAYNFQFQVLSIIEYTMLANFYRCRQEFQTILCNFF